ncbi:hypothetical protein [Nocardioides sp. BYT-33-1]|uniref:hypothetical protein n=1 Tax=Nocardioides sp. BYT-33-1 TaxID=3416952 RepID=UPI003F53CF93
MARQAPRHRGSRPGWFGRGRTRALLSTGLLLGTGAVATSAYWTDGGSVAGVGLSTGALHIDLEGNHRVKPETISDWGDLDLTALQAGQTRAAMMTVTNNSQGNAPLSYSVQAAAAGGSPALNGALRIVVRRGGTVSGTSCTGGTALGSGSPVALDGFSQPAGANLPLGGSHLLCIEVSLPAAPVLATNLSATVTFTFPAKQEP